MLLFIRIPSWMMMFFLMNGLGVLLSSSRVLFTLRNYFGFVFLVLNQVKQMTNQRNSGDVAVGVVWKGELFYYGNDQLFFVFEVNVMINSVKLFNSQISYLREVHLHQFFEQRNYFIDRNAFQNLLNLRLVLFYFIDIDV